MHRHGEPCAWSCSTLVCPPGHPGQGWIVMDVLAETVLLWTLVEGLMPRRCQGALGREELLPYLLYRAMTCSPSNSVPAWAGHIGKGSQHAAEQVTEMGQVKRQAGFYRTLTLWRRAGLHKFTLDLMWLGQGQEEKGGKAEGTWHIVCSALPAPSQAEATSPLLPCGALRQVQSTVRDCPQWSSHSFIRSDNEGR